MTLKAYNVTEDQAFGSLQFGEGTFNYTTGVEINILQDVLNDVSVLTPPGVGESYWLVVWRLYLWSFESLIRPSLFISAYPKYDLGIVTYNYGGFCSGEEYWNFTSQSFRENVFLSTTVDSSYPGEGPFPATATVANLLQTQAYDGELGKNYAHAVAVRLQSAPTDGMYGTINYKASALERPSYYYDTGF